MSRTLSLFLGLGVLVAAQILSAPAFAGPGYLRYPDVHGDSLVFVAEGDLWIAPSAGGMARRLTTHVGSESMPRFSPDGRWIAFTGQLDGNADVFVVPAAGGEPRRLTWHPVPDNVTGWSHDGKSIYFLSARQHPHGSPELYAVPADGGDPVKQPVGWVTAFDADPQSGRWAFTRTGGGGTWKRYRGGTAQGIWVGDPKRADFREITAFDGMDAFPMWHQGRIYYLSDLGGTANLWSMQPDGKDARQHTDFGTWDARYPAMGPDGRIAFMLAGDVHVFDPATGREQRVEIDLPSDRVLTRSRYPDAPNYITAWELSPDGERVVVTTRGEIFSVPVEKGVTLPITRGSGARESWASFDPKGERLVYVTDAPREEDIRTVDAWGRDEPKVVREAGDSGWHFPPSFSPDGAWIAYGDQSQRLWIVSAKGGAPRLVDTGQYSSINQYAWSPDGRWLAYAKSSRNDYHSIYIYGVESKKTERLTSDDTHCYSPAWDPDGRYLYFLSDRNTNPLLDSRDLINVNIRPTRIFAALLREDVENPFLDSAGLPPDEDDKKKEGEDEDEEKNGKDAKASKDDDDEEAKDQDEKLEPVEIDFAGLTDRIVALPIDAGQYFGVGATKTHVYYVSAPLIGMAEWGSWFEGSPSRASLMVFDLETEKTQTFMEGVNGYSLATRADKVAVMKSGHELYVVAGGTPPSDDLAESKVDLSNVVVELDPREEWAQIFHEGWRHMRDFYWDPGLGGVDWKAMRDQYASLLPRLSTRNDLGDLMAEMIGELSTSHTYVFGGDTGVRVPQRPTGLLGADLEREGNYFRVKQIYRGAPADGERAPLVEPGVNVEEGDWILEVNNLPFRKDRPFEAHLEGYADRPVLLTVNSQPKLEGARQVVVKPLGSEEGVRYADWVRSNRERVARETDGRIGYIHIPDMMQGGMIEFNTWFYPQIDREGLILDVRWNGGGFVSQMILERLRRPVLSFDRDRNGRVGTYPYRALNGPFVVLTNQFAGSDGDILPAAIQLEKLAPVIGERSWGGVVGINSLRPMVDGGLLTQPMTAWWDPASGWGLENRGVVPDIEVENTPQILARGEDAQLERAIQEVMRLHELDPPLAPSFGPVPPRGRDAYKGEFARYGFGGGAVAGAGTTSGPGSD